MGTYTQNDLDKLVNKKRGVAEVRCRMTRALAGGQSATEKGLEAFVQHHLGFTPKTQAFRDAVTRIMVEEIGERDTTPEGGEVKTEEIYAVNVIRNAGAGPYILAHMIQAMLKQSASRLGYFVSKRGAKGDMSEMGTVEAIGDSLHKTDRPWEIHLRQQDGSPAPTEYVKVSGRVSTPKGSMSIMSHTEMAPEGTEFAFRYRWMGGKIGEKQMAEIVGAATQIGIGSCKALGYGKFEVLEMTIDVPTKRSRQNLTRPDET